MGSFNSDRTEAVSLTRHRRVEVSPGPGPLMVEFLTSMVYVGRDESGTGLLIEQGPDGRRWVCAYSVLDWVPARHVDQKVNCVRVTGRHLHAMLPPNVGVRLDPGQHHGREVVTPPTTSTTDVAATEEVTGPRPGIAPDLVRDARAVHSGTGTREQLLQTFRRSHVYLARLAAGIPVATLAERGNWVCVFSSLNLLAAQMGQDGRPVLLAGRDLLDVLLPTFAGPSGPVGVFLDLGADHQISLPANLTPAGPADTGPAPKTTPREGRRSWRRRCADSAGRRDIP